MSWWELNSRHCGTETETQHHYKEGSHKAISCSGAPVGAADASIALEYAS